MKKNTTKANTWLDTLREAASSNVDKVPDGWKTVTQIANEAGMSISRVRAIVSELVNKKKVLYKRFRVASDRRGPYPVWHYLLKDKSYEFKRSRH